MKDFVSIEMKVCPICGVKHDVGVMLDKRLKKSMERETVTGYEFCNDCKEKIDAGYIALIAIDPNKSNTEGETVKFIGAYRTGQIAFVKKRVINQMFTISNKQMKDGFIFVEQDIITQLENLTKNN
jgi:hypothetical protein